MKTTHLLILAGLLALTMLMSALLSGCVVHDHGYRHAHHHGPGCGHELRGGIWITVPVIEVH